VQIIFLPSYNNVTSSGSGRNFSGIDHNFFSGHNNMSRSCVFKKFHISRHTPDEALSLPITLLSATAAIKEMIIF